MIPPRRILAAVDFSDASRAALSLAVRLACQCRAELHVLHAEDPLLAAAARAQGMELDRETREQLAEFSRHAQLPGTDLPAQHVISGDAWTVICATANRVSADVIVMGVRGMSGAERFMFGSVTERVLRRADVSVLVVPATWEPPVSDTADLSGIGPVVVAVDFSADSRAAAAAASRLAELLDTSLEAIHVIVPAGVLPRWQRQADASVAARVEAATRELEASVRNLGSTAPLLCRVDVGRVPETIAAAAAPGRDRNPILVVGSRGETETTPGATAYRILALSAAPVLVHVG